MAKFQFFCLPESGRDQFTYLDMSGERFLDEKAVLLEQGFAVEGTYIVAKTAEEAVEKFKSNWIYETEEYGNAHPEFALMTFLTEIGKFFTKRR